MWRQVQNYFYSLWYSSSSSSMSRSRRGPSHRCTNMSAVDSTPPEVSNGTGGIVTKLVEPVVPWTARWATPRAVRRSVEWYVHVELKILILYNVWNKFNSFWLFIFKKSLLYDFRSCLTVKMVYYVDSRPTRVVSNGINLFAQLYSTYIDIFVWFVEVKPCFVTSDYRSNLEWCRPSFVLDAFRIHVKTTWMSGSLFKGGFINDRFV